MPNEVMQFVGSLAAVAAIVGIAWLLGSRQRAQLSGEKEARELFSLAPGGFEPAEIAMDKEGRAAIARDADKRLAVLVPHGTRFVVRMVPSNTSIQREGDSLSISSVPGLRITLERGARHWANTDNDDNNG